MELNKINLGKQGIEGLVGGLESDILECLWRKGKCSCKDVFGCVKKRHGIAYTTAAVTLDRLHEKGLVEREVLRGKGGLKYLYYPMYSREELSNQISDRFVSFLKKTFGEPSIAYLRKKVKE